MSYNCDNTYTEQYMNGNKTIWRQFKHDLSWKFYPSIKNQNLIDWAVYNRKDWFVDSPNACKLYSQV